MVTVAQALAQAVQQHRAGQLQQAEQLYRAILQVQPQQVDALHLLGVLASQVGKHEQARAYISQALRLKPDLVEGFLNLGNILHQQGHLQEAVANLQQALRLKPAFSEAHLILGHLFHEQRQLAEAQACYQQALRLQPECTEAHYNLGHLLHEQGQLAEALACYQQVLRLQPNCAEAHNSLGATLQKQGKFAEAQACYEQALRYQPDYAEAYNNLGTVLQGQGQLAEALACYQQALHLEPVYAEAHNNLGNLLQKQGQLEKAQACYQQAVRHKPDYAEAHNNLGHLLQKRGQLAEAQVSYQQALRHKPDYAEAHNNLGNLLREQGQLAQAQACYEQALGLKPDYAKAHYNLGNVFRDHGKIAEAQACYQQALRYQPDYVHAHVNRAFTWLLTGDFEQGWPEYEWRWGCKEFSLCRLPQPVWDGSPLHGQTILLYAEQGLGDTLQFVRYAALVKECGGCVLVACQPPLVSLFSRCRGIDQVLPDGSALPSFDVWALLMSLPGILGTSLAAIPAQVPYLFPDAERMDFWRQELTSISALKIGIAWEGNPQFRRSLQNKIRSIPVTEFAPLGRLEGVHLFGLQKGPAVEQLHHLAEVVPVTDLSSRLETFEDTAAVIQNLDLVICADIMIAHLAGALGGPVWLALPFAGEWRWLLEREDSPWYPNMRLFRQQERGNWAEVFGRMATALKQRLAQGSGAPMDSYPEERG
jgi:tetratricopeptide (TPR) repeat protein